MVVSWSVSTNMEHLPMTSKLEGDQAYIGYL